MGLIAEVLSPDEMWVVGNKENLNLKVINRSAYPLKLKEQFQLHAIILRLFGPAF